MRMNETLLTNPALASFLIASLVLAATPGPGVFYIVARTMAQGTRAGLSSVAGVATGNLANAVGASIGLAALFATSSLAFTVAKYTGAIYLFYLGVRQLGTDPPAETPVFETAQFAPIFRDGCVVALLNPKTTLFFAAFLPQFIDPAASTMLQGVLFGILFVVIAVLTDSLYVLAASAALPALTRRSGMRLIARYLSAGVLIGLGLLAAVSGPSKLA
jgi:threonine/homoserine/homoserine lactone efflux protein